MDPKSKHAVIDMMADQKDITMKGGTMRLGSYTCEVKKDSKAYKAYEKTKISERHRHRYEVNNSYRPQLEAAGLVFSGTSPDGNLVEFVELPESEHPFYVGTQAHPEFKSRPTRPHPLFVGLVRAALVTKASKK